METDSSPLEYEPDVEICFQQLETQNGSLWPPGKLTETLAVAMGLPCPSTVGPLAGKESSRHHEDAKAACRGPPSEGQHPTRSHRYTGKRIVPQSGLQVTATSWETPSQPTLLSTSTLLTPRNGEVNDCELSHWTVCQQSLPDHCVCLKGSGGYGMRQWMGMRTSEACTGRTNLHWMTVSKTLDSETI